MKQHVPGTAVTRACAGIDVGGTSIKYGLCSGAGEVITCNTIPAEVEKGPESLLNRILTSARELLHHADENRLRIDHVGVGTPGVVNITTGEIIGMSPNIPGWKGANPKEKLEPELNIPVFVDNDVNVMTLAESIFGAARGYSNVITATIGTGIGGGILIGGRLYRGAVGGAGEFGHITAVKDGLECNCGKKGCLERYAAAPHLIETAEEFARNSRGDSILRNKLAVAGRLTVGDIFDAFLNRTDPLADKAVKLAADYLAVGLASVVAALDPEIIVIGGGVADAGGRDYVRLVETLLRQRAIESSAARIRVVKAELGNSAGFIGAGVLGDHT